MSLILVSGNRTAREETFSSMSDTPEDVDGT